MLAALHKCGEQRVLGAWPAGHGPSRRRSWPNCRAGRRAHPRCAQGRRQQCAAAAAGERSHQPRPTRHRAAIGPCSTPQPLPGRLVCYARDHLGAPPTLLTLICLIEKGRSLHTSARISACSGRHPIRLSPRHLALLKAFAPAQVVNCLLVVPACPPLRGHVISCLSVSCRCCAFRPARCSTITVAAPPCRTAQRRRSRSGGCSRCCG